MKTIIITFICITAFIIGVIADTAVITDWILTHVVNDRSEDGTSPTIPIIEKDISPRACTCFEATCSMCRMRPHAGNDLKHPDPSVPSSHEQPVQTHSENDLKHPDPSVPSSHEQPVQTHSESEQMIQRKAKQIEGWYDPIWNQQKIEGWYDPIWNQQKAKQQIANP